MPFTVNDLIDEAKPVIKTTLKESVPTILRQMIEHNYTQLPVVDDQNRVLGIINHQTILQSLNNFNVPLGQLRVVDAMIDHVEKFRPDADLFEILDKLEDQGGVALVVDRDQKLQGIVTTYDTTQYFRQRAEDIMLVEDIETTLKDYILLSFNNLETDQDQAALDQLIAAKTDRGKQLKKNFNRALNNYLGLTQQQNFNDSAAQQVFDKYLNNKNSRKKITDLSLNDYIEIFFHQERWHQYATTFHLQPKQIRNLLQNVRDIRNTLAHFKDEITADQREQLHFCARWLARHHDDLTQLFHPQHDDDEEDEEILDQPELDTEAEPEKNLLELVAPVEEETDSADNRYAPLAIWLQSRQLSTKSISLSFEKVAEIIGEPLPESAYRHRTWWSNDPVGSVQAREWLGVDWRVASVSMTQAKVKFTRTKERERNYIDFYSKLLTDLEQYPDFKDLGISPSGTSWIQVIRGIASVASLNFSFTRHNQFRAELYIDSGDQKENKKVFDILRYKYKEEIETAVGQPLSWERLDSRRACRIALYFDGSIYDNDTLPELRRQAVDGMVRLAQAIAGPVQQAAENDSTHGLRTPEENYYVPLLQALVDLGGQSHAHDVIRLVGKYMKNQLNEYDYAPLDSTQKPRWRNATQWARSNLVKKGLMSKDSPRGIWAISKAGRSWLSQQST